MSNRCTVVYQNLSDNSASDVVVLLRNTRANAVFAPPIAWQVLRNWGERTFHKFVHTADPQVKVVWEGGIVTTDAVEGTIYALEEGEGQPALVRTDGVAANEIVLLNELHSPGVEIALFRDGKPTMMQRDVPYGTRVEFGLESTIWVALANGGLEEGETLTRDVTSLQFTPIDLTGLSSLTFGLYGSRETAYTFRTISKTIQAPDYFARRKLAMPRSAFGIPQ